MKFNKLTRPRNLSMILLAVLFLAYLAWVVSFELWIGLEQPRFGNSTLVITTTDADGDPHERVLGRLQDGEDLYVAVNHWPRAWYRQALANPDVEVTMNGETHPYRAIPVSDEEHDYLMERFPIGFGGRAQMGFAPRYFLKLEPRNPSDT